LVWKPWHCEVPGFSVFRINLVEVKKKPARSENLAGFAK
jgi:hypothetical protein